jgi:hypothetical protein
MQGLTYALTSKRVMAGYSKIPGRLPTKRVMGVCGVGAAAARSRAGSRRATRCTAPPAPRSRPSPPNSDAGPPESGPQPAGDVAWSGPQPVCSRCASAGPQPGVSAGLQPVCLAGRAVSAGTASLYVSATGGGGDSGRSRDPHCGMVPAPQGASPRRRAAACLRGCRGSLLQSLQRTVVRQPSARPSRLPLP